MPKLKNRPPKLCKNGNYAFVRYQGEKISLGRWGSDESKQAYARFITEIQNNPLPNLVVARSVARVSAPVNQEGLISELAVLYLVHIKANNIQHSDYSLCKTILEDFLLPLYADFPANSFSPKCLKHVRANMVSSGRYCREQINKSIRRIIAMFSYGVEEELCLPQGYYKNNRKRLELRKEVEFIQIMIDGLHITSLGNDVVRKNGFNRFNIGRLSREFKIVPDRQSF